MMNGGMRRELEREWCVCGETIYSLSREPADVFDAVMRHNRGAVHRAWRRARGIEP